MRSYFIVIVFLITTASFVCGQDVFTLSYSLKGGYSGVVTESFSISNKEIKTGPPASVGEMYIIPDNRVLFYKKLIKDHGFEKWKSHEPSSYEDVIVAKLTLIDAKQTKTVIYYDAPDRSAVDLAKVKRLAAEIKKAAQVDGVKKSNK